MKYSIISTTEGFEKLRMDWTLLEKNDPTLPFFSSFKWCYSWWNIYKYISDYSLFIITLNQEKRVVAIAPLVIRKSRNLLFSYSTLEFISMGDYHDFLLDIDTQTNTISLIREIFDIIEIHKDKWDEINLTHISQHSRITQYLLKSKKNEFLRYLMENPFIDFSAFKDFNHYCQDFLPSKTIQYYNRLQRDIPFRLEISSENIIQKLGDIHIDEKNEHLKRGKRNRHSLFEDEKRKQFIESIYEQADNIISYFLVSNLNNSIIGYNTGFLHNDRFHSFNTAFSPKYYSYGIGKILYYCIFKENFTNRKWRLFDTGTGRYQWKFEWTNTFTLIYRFHYIKPSTKGKRLIQFQIV